MASETVLEEESYMKISGKGIVREGVEAFVFIHLDSWLTDTEPLGSETRDKLFRQIIDNLWRSFMAAGHCIGKVTTCMVIPERDKQAYREWKAPVDQIFEAFWKDTGFRLWCNAFVPTTVPIVVAVVTYSDNEFHNALFHIRHRNMLALHRLHYESAQGFPFMAGRIYSHDSEGTIEIWHQKDKADRSAPQQIES